MADWFSLGIVGVVALGLALAMIVNLGAWEAFLRFMYRPFTQIGWPSVYEPVIHRSTVLVTPVVLVVWGLVQSPWL